METIHVYLRYIHIIVYFTLVGTIIPVYHLSRLFVCRCCCQSLSKVQIPNSSPRADALANKSEITSDLAQQPKFSKTPKILLSISIIFSTLYLITTAFETTLMFLPFNNNESIRSLCISMGALRLIFYIYGRSFLYFFFLLRTQRVFKGSSLSFSKMTIFTMSLFPCFVLFIIATVLCLLQGSAMYWDVGSDEYGNGIYCISEANSSNLDKLYKGIYVFGQFVDVIYAYLSVHLLVSKLFRLIYSQNEINQRKQNNAAKNDRITMQDIDTFHVETQVNNEMILMISKLLILLIIAIVSSQFTLIMVLVLPEYVIVWYSIDCMINTYTFWLNFSFAQRYFDKYFCGKWCIKCWFPLVKSTALTCNDECNRDNNFCTEICCCCCYACKHCIFSRHNRQKQMALYVMAKAEVELVMDTKQCENDQTYSKK